MEVCLIISHFSFLISHFLCLPLHPLLSKSNTGEMVEWSITAVLKTAALRGAGGSNPSLSATAENQQVRKLPPKLPPKMVILGVILHPLFGVSLIDDMLKVLKFQVILIFS